MRSRNSLSAFALCLLATGPSVAAERPQPAGPVEVTAEKTKICEEALANYKAANPGATADGKQLVFSYKYTFCPPNLKIKAGTTVRWVNVEKRTSHSVWLRAAGIAESPRLFPEETWEQTFDAPGRYPYLCGPHWEQEGMFGFVEVTP